MLSDMNGKANYISDEEGETRVTLAGGTESRAQSRPRWTRLEQFLAALCILLATVSIILVVVVAAQNIHKDTNAPGHVLTHKDGQPYHIVCVPGVDQALTKPKEGVCLTEGCVKAASRILTAMDPTVDPCDNFFEFACGSWNRINIIPDDRPRYNTFYKLDDDLHGMLKGIIEQPVSDSDREAVRKAKYLYASCNNETLIDLQGLGPIKSFLAALGGWPMVSGPSWRGEDVDLMELIVQLRLFNNKVLIDNLVGPDDKNSEVNIILLDQPELAMVSPDYYLNPDDTSFLRVYEKYATQVALMLGADPSFTPNDVRQMVQLEIQLANITVPQGERRDNEKLYHKMTVRELSEAIPGFDWLRYLRKVFEPVHIDIDEMEEVIVYAPGYLQKMATIYSNTDKRILANYLIWRFMMNHITELPKLYRNIKKDYDKKMKGSESERPRWRECMTFVNEQMGDVVGRLFVEKHFDETSKTTAMEMIHNIRDAFYDLIDESDWMDEATRIVAREKAKAILEEIGYDDRILNDTALDGEYADVTFSPRDYFENVLANLRHVAKANLKLLRKPVDRNKWSTAPAVVNAFYSAPKNQIVFPAGILQPPFYSKDHPTSLNYGGIGMVIGHEITHGFDDKGRQFDKNGNLVQWWDNAVIERFKERAQCIVQQYNNYTLPDLNLRMNGVQTQGENIADNGGIKEAYRAYKKVVKERGTEEPRLPGLLNYTHDQLFFISFAQVWCGTMRPEAAVNKIKTSVHCPGRFRVIGTLQNQDSFSEAFQCPRDSYMNPPHKCSVW